MGDNRPDFSFSGLKTAVRARIWFAAVTSGGGPSQAIKDLAASFQHTVVRSLVSTMEQVRDYSPRTRSWLAVLPVTMPCASPHVKQPSGSAFYLLSSPHLSTDNATMIAAAGTDQASSGRTAGWDLNADVMLRLQNIEVEDAELRSACDIDCDAAGAKMGTNLLNCGLTNFDDWARYHSRRPPVLYHYEMLNTRRLWATNSGFMNDPTG